MIRIDDPNLPRQEPPAPADCTDTTGLTSPPDPELVAEGWERRNVASPDRVDEVRELYESLGFEVLVRPMSPDDFGSKCNECAVTACTSYVVIYTRKKSAG